MDELQELLMIINELHWYVWLAIIAVAIIVCSAWIRVKRLELACKHKWEPYGEQQVIYDHIRQEDALPINRLQPLRCKECGDVKVASLIREEP